MPRGRDPSCCTAQAASWGRVFVGCRQAAALAANHFSDAFNPSIARPAVTAQATQLAQNGIVVSAIIMVYPAKARRACKRATTVKMLAARRE